ncbi:MAG: endonuclease/exonuclease/phosphatase family protein [Frankiaceae bacterium]|nr:endonuclease/exonuclease/phosphatase family protein [Frankiaceae bacterium]
MPLVLAWLLVAALAVVVVVRALGAERGTLLVLLVGALPLVLLPAYPVMLAALLSRRWALAGLSAAVVVAHGLILAPALGAADLPPDAQQPRLRVVTANLYVLNPSFEDAGRVLRALRPDVLVVPELSEAGLQGLRTSGLLDDLPYSVVRLGSREETVGLFSTRPLRDVTTRSAGGRELPRATVVVDDVPVRLLTAHPLPPLPLLESRWRASLQDLAAESAEVDLPMVVAGDLNADRDHALFRDLLGTGLRDAHDSVGRGLARTWPSGLPVLHLDHVLVRDGEGARIAVTRVREERVPGSDHRAVVADLAVLPD